ncbi:MAG TPA: RNA-binding domain-containing protein [Candidatus Sulfotelmatobacter sp.]|jgi:RNA binding exosome subunit|nr:RNA-binding domain-containing protein [Candidatus Sulfotelmatobacter sp.]
MNSPATASSVKISTITHATEDPEKVSRAIRNLSLSEPSLGFKVNRAKGHHGNEIATRVLTIRNAKKSEIFLKNIWSSLSHLDRTEVFSSLASRIDSAGTMFLRIDKQEALKGRIRLENTDPVKIEISFRTEPSKRNELVDNIRKRLEEIQD